MKNKLNLLKEKNQFIENNEKQIEPKIIENNNNIQNFQNINNNNNNNNPSLGTIINQNIIQIEKTSNKREKIINKPNINNVKIISECVPNYNKLNVDDNIVKINELERLLKEEKEKNKKLTIENKNLKEANIKLNMENEKLKELKKIISKLNDELNQIKELKQKMENDLAQKDIEIQKLLSKKNKDYYDISDISALNKDDKIIAVIFVSMGNSDIGQP